MVGVGAKSPQSGAVGPDDGTIAAAVLTPIAAIAVLIGLVCRYKKKSASSTPNATDTSSNHAARTLGPLPLNSPDVEQQPYGFTHPAPGSNGRAAAVSGPRTDGVEPSCETCPVSVSEDSITTPGSHFPLPAQAPPLPPRPGGNVKLDSSRASSNNNSTASEEKIEPQVRLGSPVPDQTVNDEPSSQPVSTPITPAFDSNLRDMDLPPATPSATTSATAADRRGDVLEKNLLGVPAAIVSDDPVDSR